MLSIFCPFHLCPMLLLLMALFIVSYHNIFGLTWNIFCTVIYTIWSVVDDNGDYCPRWCPFSNYFTFSVSIPHFHVPRTTYDDDYYLFLSFNSCTMFSPLRFLFPASMLLRCRCRWFVVFLCIPFVVLGDSASI